jgi:Ti-type conjugative transfer relaxase TraA
VAIYHFSAKVIQRSAGRSAVAAAAYRAAELLHDDMLDRDHDFTAKTGVVHSEIMLPEGAPERWRQGESKEEKRATRELLWNEVEVVERRKDAVLAREVEFALPRELSRAEGIRLARDFVQEQFVDRGMVADLAVHWTVEADGEAKPHAHVMLAMREIEGDGFGKKQRAWNDKALLREWRERWGELANERLCELGHDVRIDHRSYAEQGIGLEPQHKIGPAGARRAERGEDAERAREHEGIARRNGERIAADPSVVLDALTRQHSTFTRHELARFINRHTDGAEQFTSVMAVVEASPELVRLGQDGRGRERFTTREMLATEQRMERAAAGLAGGDAHRVLQVAGWRALRAAERDGLVLGEEQRDAYRHVTSGRDLAVVVGYAGTGKSAMLGVARQAWEAEGYRVRGAALSGIAAEGLEAGSGIRSRTLASLEWGWKAGRDELTSRDVLVVDEAGMVGSRQMERVLSAARQAGAKVVLVGDPEQLQAIEAGAAFRAIAERHGAVEISAVRRQRVEWQREATRELATGRTGAALGRYEAAGMVVGHGTREEARAGLVAGWDQERRAAPGQSRVILAYTRADVAALNELARERLRAAGELGAEHQVATERGARAFAAGDRLMFLKNERGLGAGPVGVGGVAVKNGSLGTVLAVEAQGERLTVRLDGPGSTAGAGPEGKDSRPVVTFCARDYGHVDHGYAATIHKAQGVTVDRAHVLASSYMDRHAAYVALTRHRDGVSLHYGREEFADSQQLARTLSRERLKDTSLDYDAGPSGAECAGEELTRRYAERRGLDPLRPVSEIVVRQGPERQAPVPEASAAAERQQRPAPGQGLRERLGGARADGTDPVGEAQREVGLERLRRHVRAGAGAGDTVADPLAQARADAERLRAEAGTARLVPGTVEWAASGFQQAWGEVRDYRERFGRALPEQERALEQAEKRLEQALPRGAEMLGEALAAGRIGAGQRVELGSLRRAAVAREGAHRDVAAYRAAEGEIGRTLQGLERGWRGTAKEHERHAALVERRWGLARAVVADPEKLGVLGQADSALAEQARALAAVPAEKVVAAAQERMRHLEATERSRQVQAQRQSRGMSM